MNTINIITDQITHKIENRQEYLLNLRCENRICCTMQSETNVKIATYDRKMFCNDIEESDTFIEVATFSSRLNKNIRKIIDKYFSIDADRAAQDAVDTGIIYLKTDLTDRELFNKLDWAAGRAGRWY